MTKIAMVAGVLLAGGGLGFGQPQVASNFDVASIRASSGPVRRNFDLRGEEIQYTPDGVIMRNVTLKSCLRSAYHVMDYQVTGPESLTSSHYDIVAKAGTAASQDELRLMLQGLLAQRFKVTLHREKKELPAYVLSIAKGGPKVHESQTNGDMDIQPDQRRMSLSVQRASLEFLADALSNVLRMPVVDETGLKGRYDVSVDVSKYVMEHQDGPMDPLSIIGPALQQEFGLKLEARKMNLDLLVVDHAEKSPTEN